jgi:hypothetical protein
VDPFSIHRELQKEKKSESHKANAANGSRHLPTSQPP